MRRPILRTCTARPTYWQQLRICYVCESKPDMKATVVTHMLLKYVSHLKLPDHDSLLQRHTTPKLAVFPRAILVYGGAGPLDFQAPYEKTDNELAALRQHSIISGVSCFVHA